MTSPGSFLDSAQAQPGQFILSSSECLMCAASGGEGALCSPRLEPKGKGGGWAAVADFFQRDRNHCAYLTAMKSKNVSGEV